MTSFPFSPSAVPLPPLSLHRLRAGLDRFRTAMKARAEHRRTLAALARLDDRLLEDIGLPRQDDFTIKPFARFGGGLL